MKRPPVSPTQQPNPITDAEAAGLFAGLERFGVLGLAVSGGPDSLALLHLVARWRAGLALAPHVLVMTVDHELRPESAEEARFVAREAAALGFSHETLVWTGEKPATGIAQAAREARYRLMAHRLVREGALPRALVAAHTLDDQAETVLIRLARGSGVEGLGGMMRERDLPGAAAVCLVRPLLGIAKARLEATLSAFGRAWIRDPTNADPAFERPRLRQSLLVREEAGLTNAALARSAGRVARANAALEAATDGLEARVVKHVPAIEAVIERVPFCAAPEELRIRLLGRLLGTYGGAHPAARLSEVERLAARLGLDGAAAGTLGGCVVAPSAATILVHREAGRGLPVLDLAPGQTALWDRRFTVALDAGAPGPCTVRALSGAEWRALRGRGEQLMTAREGMTVPSFWHDGLLVGLPQAGSLSGAGDLERTLHPRAGPGILAAFGMACRSSAIAIKAVQ